MAKDLLTAMAKKNGLNEDMYVQLVRKKAGKKFPHYSEEVAILRKEVAFLRTVIEQLLGQALPVTEFVDYNNTIEELKTESKVEMIC